MDSPLIEVVHLKKYFKYKEGLINKRCLDIKAIDDLSLTVNRGEILGIVGESGSGKTTLARVILGLTRPTDGNVRIDGVDMHGMNRHLLKGLRKKVAVVFQDPASNLNPRQSVESSIMRPMLIHGVSRNEAKERAKKALEKVKMDFRYLKSYPHQLSGGQLQRIAVARALVLEPQIMILDEPTSALDISIQAQVLNLLLDLQEEMNLTYLIITHDLNVIRYISDKIAVMYMGKLVEYGDTETVFKKPEHPYTAALMSVAPIAHPSLRGNKDHLMQGEIGSLINVGEGCRLAPRCLKATEKCKTQMPLMYEVNPNHTAACYLINERRENNDRVYVKN